MQLVNHDHQPTEEWRSGVLTRMHISTMTGSTGICIFEQWCEPGRGAPTHLHNVEEVLTIRAGNAEIWVGDERATVLAGQSVVVPRGVKHGFANIGDSILHVEAVLAAAFFEAWTDVRKEPMRRWAKAD